MYVRTWEPLAEQFDADDGLRRGCLHSPVQAGLAVIVLSMDINLGERAGRRVASNNIHSLITRKRLIGCVERFAMAHNVASYVYSTYRMPTLPLPCPAHPHLLLQ